MIGKLKIMFIEKNWLLLAMMALSFSIPIHRKLASIFIVLLLLTAIFTRKEKKRNISVPIILMASLYILQCFAVLKSDNFLHGLTELEYKASFIIFPIIYYLIKPFNKSEVLMVLKSFVYGTIVYMSITLILGAIRWISNGDITELSYYKLAIGVHPSYYALYCCFAVLVLFYDTLENSMSKRKNAFNTGISIFLILYTSLLASKAGIIAMLISIVSIIVFTLINRNLNFQKVIYRYSALFVLLLFFSSVSPLALKRFLTIADSQLADHGEILINPDGSQGNKLAQTSGDVRWVAWKSAVELIPDNPFGVGSGEVTIALKKLYLRDGQTTAYDKNINAHNQFFQSTLEIGWFGGLVLISLFAYCFIIAIKNKNFLFAIFLIIVTFNMLIESFFEHQAGIVFISFFLLLISEYEKGKSAEIKNL